MASKSSKWLWYGLGAVGLIAVGTGVFLYRKKRKLKNQTLEIESASTITAPTNTGSTNTSSGSSGASPFATAAEGNAFRAWVNDNYPAYAKEIELDRTGSHTNSYILKAWAKYGGEYSKKSTTTPSGTPNQGGSTPWTIIKTQMLDKNVWNGNSRLSEDSTDKIQFGINVDGFYDVYVNFTPTGGFWLEKLVGGKFQGSWSFSNGVFTLKMNDGSFNSNDNEISEMVKQVMKIKYPSEMKYYSFEAPAQPTSAIDELLTKQGKQHVDFQDATL